MTSVDMDLLSLLIVWAHDVHASPMGEWVSTEDAMAAIKRGREAE